jgi:ubiquinone/menaquinone biosynthesis C-methylase UbiE
MAKDLFSSQAATYAKFRPGYPAELIDYVLGFVPEKNIAWDCATGNGQAAVLVAKHFKQVNATDSSEAQLLQAEQVPNIVYSLANADASNFPDQYFDLITVAQAYHWLPFASFEKELRRVGKPAAVIAVWGYNIPQCREAGINALIHEFYTDTIGKYWDPERKYIDESYQTIPFPYPALPTKNFTIEVQWNLAHLRGYLNSWSSVQHFIKQQQYNPVDDLLIKLATIWPKQQQELLFQFPVFLRMGRL